MAGDDLLHLRNDGDRLGRAAFPAVRRGAADAGLLADAGEIQADRLCVGLDLFDALLENVIEFFRGSHAWPLIKKQ